MTHSKSVVILILVAAVTFGLAALWVDSPGYLDAEYYRSVALRLATGQGLTVPFLWNFLSGVRTLPAPAHTYWMPLTSIVGVLSTWIAPESFRSTQMIFVLLAVLLPVATYAVGRRIGLPVRSSTTAGLLACFPGFFLPFWLTSDTFVLFAFAGAGVFLWGEEAARRRSAVHTLLAGIAVGVGHLSRADGFLLWIPLLVLLMGTRGGRFRGIGLAALGHLLVVAPWLVRNLLSFDSILPPGLSRAMWLTSYDQLFAYPAESFGWRSFIESGLGQIALARAGAAWTNLKSLVLVNGLMFLALPMAVGGWNARSNPIVRAAGAYLVSLFVVMSLVFPFAGSRGGFYHSSSALMPVLYPLAVAGIGPLGDWYARRRGQEPHNAVRLFRAGGVAIAFVVTIFLFNLRVVQGGWGNQFRAYQRLQQSWAALDSRDRVAVNNPAAFWLATGIEAVVIPDGPPQVLAAVLDDYDAEWALLESDHPQELNDLYEQPADQVGLTYEGSIEAGSGMRMRIYRLAEAPGPD